MKMPVAMMLCVVVGGGLIGCAPRLPESGPGPGFSDYNSYVRERAAISQAQGSGMGSYDTGAGGYNAPAAPTAFSTDIAASAIAEAEGGAGVAPALGPTVAPPLDPMALAPIALDANRPRGNAPAGIVETTSEMGYVTGGVSDEQDFSAVSARQTIESDKARIEANRAQYVVVQPGALPVRAGDSGPNIAQYAIATNNPVGVELYDRPAFYLVNVKVACTRYTSPDLAQQAFLGFGGPQKDPKGLDPDGDGFACAWDPRPFRAALQ